MVKNKKTRTWGLRLLLIFFFCGTLSYAIVGGFGSPENSSRQLDGPNGAGTYCEPPGSLCHAPV